MQVRSMDAPQGKPLRTRSMLIVGASRGIGAAMAARYAGRVDDLVTVSRTPAAHGRWVAGDISKPDQIRHVAATYGSNALDALLVLGGIWERDAFTDAYAFARSPAEETTQVVAVNLMGPILLVQALLANLMRSDNPRVVFLGSLSGLDNNATREVANSAAKYGLRGAAQAMAIELQPYGIGFTVVNPGNVATDEVLDDITAGRVADQIPIPIADLAVAIDSALAMSPNAVIREINIVQRWPGDPSA